MITNTPKTIIVDGVNVASPNYKRNETEIAEAGYYIASENGHTLGVASVVVTDEIKGYFIRPILLHEVSVYDISGIVAHGDRLVYISSGFKGGDIESLKNNVIAVAYADKSGNFKFTNINYKDGTASLWTTYLAQDATTASLIYDLSVVDYNPNIGDILTYSFNEPEGEYDNPLFTITGICSNDIETIYVSCAENATSIAHLTETICSSTAPSEGTFEIECSGDYDENYIVWALSKHNGFLSVEDIAVSNDNSTCLSGDTMITIADNSLKRMDKISVGDIVLSKNGIPSRVHTVRRGCFSDYHTLYYFEDGTIINETHPHRFYNVDQGFWQRLQLWNIGDHAINQDGKEIALISVERIEEKVEMFGIWTEDGTYYANGLLSGAAFCNKELLAEATAEQAIDMMLSTDEELLVKLMGLEGVLP